MSAVKLNVGTITGKSFSVDVLATDTVRDVKRRIEEEEDIPREAQILIFREKTLADAATVKDLGLQEGSKIQLAVQMTGGLFEHDILFLYFVLDLKESSFTIIFLV